MPIYMELEGIKGTVKPNNHTGGANFGLMDGSVRDISRSIGGGPRINVFSGRDHRLGNSANGHKFTLGRHFDAGTLEVSRIALPNSSAEAIDALAPNAVVKAKALFEEQRSMVTSLGVVFSILTSDANKMRHTHNLKQIGLAARGQISTVRIFITDNSNPTGVMVELQNCLITNYSLSGHGGAASAGGGTQGKPTVLHFNFMK